MTDLDTLLLKADVHEFLLSVAKTCIRRADLPALPEGDNLKGFLWRFSHSENAVLQEFARSIADDFDEIQNLIGRLRDFQVSRFGKLIGRYKQSWANLNLESEADVKRFCTDLTYLITQDLIDFAYAEFPVPEHPPGTESTNHPIEAATLTAFSFSMGHQPSLIPNA